MTGDLHCHTKLSDSSMGIDDLIVLAKARGVETISITDHDCQAGNTRGKIIGARRGITVIPGVELSALDSAREKCADILCYHTDSPDRLEGLCHKNITARKRASQYMALKVAKRYPITTELVIKCAAGATCVFIEHIMHALMECGITDRIHSPLFDELFSPESADNVLVKPRFSEPAEVLAAIHDAGGIAVLAHPGHDSSDDLLRELVDLGLDGVEVWTPMHDENATQKYFDFAQEHNLLMTGGSNFHGMYGRAVSPGDYLTPAENMKALSGYKAMLKKSGRK